jgi:hypothetical protein
LVPTARLVPAGLTALLAALPLLTPLALLTRLAVLRLLLTGLTALTWLPARESTGLELLSAGLAAGAAGLLPLAWLTLAWLTAGTSAEAVQLVAQTSQIVHGFVDGGIFRASRLRTSQSAGRIPHLLPQLLQIGGEGSLRRIGETAAAQLIRTALHTCTKVGFIHAFKRAA